MKRFALLFVFASASAVALVLTVAFAAGGGMPDRAQNRSARRAEKAAEKAIQTAREIDSLIAHTNFQFVPYEVYVRGQRSAIQRYQYTKFLPGRVYIRMSAPPDPRGFVFQGFYDRGSLYNRAELQDDRWFVDASFDYHTGKIDLEFVIKRSTGEATLQATDVRRGVRAIYVGWIQPN